MSVTITANSNNSFRQKLIIIQTVLIIISVGYSDGLRAGRAGFDSRQGKHFLFSITSRTAVSSTYPLGDGGSFSEVKGPGRETNHSHPSNVEAKNDGVIPPLPHTCSRRVFNNLSEGTILPLFNFIIIIIIFK
jgi:hypothetical protein